MKRYFSIATSVVFGSLILWNCEPDADQLGSQFFQNGAVGTESTHALIAFHVNNNDSIRTDAARLQSATLGAFYEPQFGLQKSSYVSQVRLPNYSPDFGTNAVLDSAVLVIKPLYASDSVKTTTQEDYIYPVGAVPAKKVVNTYPVLKYGKTKLNGKTNFNIRVHEVTDFLFSNAQEVYSNKVVGIGNQIGGRSFNGDISSIKITKDSDNSDLYLRDATLRIPMDSAFFQNKIIRKASSPELADAASFIRYFRGIRLSVDETDGYLFNFEPNSVVINLYYKKDRVNNGTTTREEGTFTLDLGSGNTHFNQILNDRSNTPLTTLAQDTIQGSKRVYAQGMGGPGFGLKIPDSTIAMIRDRYNTQKIGIISAKLRVYTDEATWNNAFLKPSLFTVQQKGLDEFLEDLSALAYTSNYKLIKSYNLDKNPAYYEIGITQTFKNIIEKQKPNRQFIMNVGTYTTDATGTLAGLQDTENAQHYNTRSYTPNRVVLVGTDPANEKSAKLILTYGKK